MKKKGRLFDKKVLEREKGLLGVQDLGGRREKMQGD